MRKTIDYAPRHWLLPHIAAESHWPYLARRISNCCTRRQCRQRMQLKDLGCSLRQTHLWFLEPKGDLTWIHWHARLWSTTSTTAGLFWHCASVKFSSGQCNDPSKLMNLTDGSSIKVASRSLAILSKTLKKLTARPATADKSKANAKKLVEYEAAIDADEFEKVQTTPDIWSVNEYP